MFCGKCGSEIKEGGKFCVVCGTPVDMEFAQTESGTPVSSETVKENIEVPVQMASETVVSNGAPEVNTEVLQQSAFDNTQAVWNSAPVNEPKKGKKKGIFVAIAAVAVVLVVGAAACIVNAASLNNFLHKTFSSPEEYFRYIMKKELAAESKNVGGLYSDIISKFNFYDTGYNVEMTVELGEDIKALVALADAYSDLKSEGVDLSKLESFKMGTGMSIKDSLMGNSLTIDINQAALLSLNSITDLEQGKIYFQIPELSEKYLGIDMEDYASEYYYDVDSLAEFQNKNKEIIEALPKQEDVEEMYQRYSNIVFEKINDVTIGDKKQLKVEGITQKCTELKVNVDSKTAQKVMEALIKEALKDKKIEKMIKGIADAAGQDGDDIYDEFVDSLEDAKSSLESMGQDDAELEMKIYVDNKGNVIGMVMDFEDSRSSILSVTKGKAVAYEVSLVEDKTNIYFLSGKGKTSGRLLTGDFSLEVDDKPIADLKVSNLDMNTWEKGYFNGSVEIILSSEMADALAEEFDASIESFVEDSTILIDCKSSANEAEYKVTVNYDKEKLIAVVLNVKSGSGSEASIPDSKSVIMMEDEEDLLTYVSGIDWDKVVAGLKETGVFADFAETLKDSAKYLEDMMDMYGFSGDIENFPNDRSTPNTSNVPSTPNVPGNKDLFGQAGFNASAYLQATLDNSYKNDASGLVKLGIGTAEEAANLYEDGIDMEMESFLSGLTVSETLKAEFREVFKDIFSKVKYTVGEAEEQADGSYVVAVSYEKMQVFAPMVKDYTTAIMNFTKDKNFTALSDEQQTEKMLKAMVDSMKKVSAFPTYETSAEMTVRIERVNGAYTPNKSDLMALENALFDMDALQ